MKFISLFSPTLYFLKGTLHLFLVCISGRGDAEQFETFLTFFFDRVQAGSVLLVIYYMFGVVLVCGMKDSFLAWVCLVHFILQSCLT